MRRRPDPSRPARPFGPIRVARDALAVLAVLAAASGSAVASDMLPRAPDGTARATLPRARSAPERATPAPAQSWTGFYVGTTGGWARGRTDAATGLPGRQDVLEGRFRPDADP